MGDDVSGWRERLDVRAVSSALALLARAAAVRDIEIAVQRVAALVLNASALADRMAAKPSRDLDGTRERKARVAVLRDATRAGQEAIIRLSAHPGGLLRR